MIPIILGYVLLTISGQSADPIATSLSNQPNQNIYDSIIVQYANEYGLNPMLLKAEIYDESDFNATQISHQDTEPVCGTGHSYGLLQYTPACFDNISKYGITSWYAPNSKVLYGLNGVPAVIQCSDADKGITLSGNT